MPFLLARGADNLPAEVQRWQYFLLRQGFPQVGRIDASFGMKTELATRFFQTKAGLATSGALDIATIQAAASLGYTIVPDNYYAVRAGAAWPPKPAGISSPSNAWRNATFTCFLFRQVPRAARPDAEAIVITESCDGTQPDWTNANIVDLAVPQMKFAASYPGRLPCHKLAAPKIKTLFEAWEAADLLHLILLDDGGFEPRYKRNKSPGDAAQPIRKSSATTDLSNHAFGSAFDMNYEQNQFPAVPAFCGQKGSTRELAEVAGRLDFYWGGYFDDGNHFELAKI